MWSGFIASGAGVLFGVLAAINYLSGATDKAIFWAIMGVQAVIVAQRERRQG